MRRQNKFLRALAFLMALVMAPTLLASAANDVYTGQALVGEYGYYAKVRVEVGENGEIVSVSDNGTEPGAGNQSYWNRALEGGVFAPYVGVESYLVEYYEDVIDAVTGATASSGAVFQAVVNAVNGEPETPDSPFEIDDLGVLKEYGGDEERVEIPSGVAELDEYSFSAKERVRTVVIPATVEYINTSAFLNCPALTEFIVDADNARFYAEDGVIYEKGADKLILFPCGRTGSYGVRDGVRELGAGAFFSTSLTSLQIPASVTAIGEGLIDLSESLSEILVDEGNAVYASADGLLCNKALDTLLLVPSAISGEHTIPDSIHELGEGVFYGCNRLTKITLPIGLEAVPALAFAGCSNLREIVFPESVVSIGDRAFAGCNALTSFTVPRNVSALGTYLFSNAAGLLEILAEEGNEAFSSIDGVLFSADGRTLIQYPTGRAGDYIVPDGTVQLAAGSFYSAELIEAVTIPDSVTIFGNGDGTPLGSLVFGLYNYPAHLRIIANEGSAAAEYAASLSIEWAAPSAPVEDDETEYQEAPGKTIAKDTSVIAPPKKDGGGHIWDSVYFGQWDGQPVKYRVLDPEQGNNGNPDALFLLSENLLGSGDWGGVWYHNAGGNARSNAWQGSDAHAWCQDFAGLSDADDTPDSFTSAELQAVASTDKSDAQYGTYPVYAASENILQGDRVFFPSGEELSRARYGFTSALDRQAVYGGSDKSVYYWTRSPILHEYGITYSVGVVNPNGAPDTGVVDDVNTARPALNLLKSRIAFVSAAENGKASGAGADALTAVTDYDGSEWKLTLRAEDRDVSVSDAFVTDGVVSFRYQGAATGENEYLSAVVTDTDGIIFYYGRLLPLPDTDSAQGNASVRLPDGYDAETQTLYVFSEQYNGDRRTDLAGNYAAVPTTATVEMRLVSFDGNGGAGSMDSREVVRGGAFTLPENGFTAPVGKKFRLWTIQGVEMRPGDSYPVFSDTTVTAQWESVYSEPSTTSQGCYVATAVYGSYDCPEVWTLRRFRDEVLAETWYGRLFIRLYYTVSPTAVELFGDSPWFRSFFRERLDRMVAGLQESGFESTPYQDMTW